MPELSGRDAVSSTAEVTRDAVLSSSCACARHPSALAQEGAARDRAPSGLVLGGEVVLNAVELAKAKEGQSTLAPSASALASH